MPFNPQAIPEAALMSSQAFLEEAEGTLTEQLQLGGDRDDPRTRQGEVV